MDREVRLPVPCSLIPHSRTGPGRPSGLAVATHIDVLTGPWPPDKATMTTLQRARNARGKSPICAAAIFAYTPRIAGINFGAAPGQTGAPGNLPGLTQLRSSKAPPVAAGWHLRRNAFAGVRPFCATTKCVDNR